MFSIVGQRVQKFDTLEQAVNAAKEQVMRSVAQLKMCVPIWNEEINVIVCVITDDANGITVHHLYKKDGQ